MQLHQCAIRGYAAELGECFRELQTLPLDPSRFAELAGVYTTDQLPELVCRTARRALIDAQIAPEEVDLLLYVSALPESQSIRPGAPELLDRFSYIGTWLQNEIELTRCKTIGIHQQGCSALFGAIDLACAKLLSNPSIQNILCVGGDVLPSQASRFIFHNAISDAAAAVVVSLGSRRYRIVGVEQLTKAYFWDPRATESELLANYFPSGKAVVDRLLARLQLTPADIQAVLPTGIRRNSWPILLKLWGIPEERCLYPPQPFGHTIHADPILALHAAEASGRLSFGMRILLFTFGFGATWSAAVLEVC